MAQYNGSEFNSEKGTQGNLLKFLWSKIHDKFPDVASAISTALQGLYTKSEIDTKVTTLENSISSEATARANADNELLALVTGYKNITPWNPANAFPTVSDLGLPFKEGNFVQVTADGVVDGVSYKAGDIIICTVDGATSVSDFADVQSNIEIATSTIYGTVKLLADLAAYQSAGNDSSAVTKVTLQAILGDLSSTLTSAFQSADSALQTVITNAYNQAISDALANYVTTATFNQLKDRVSNTEGSIANKADTTYVDSQVVTLKYRDNALLDAIKQLVQWIYIPVRHVLVSLSKTGNFYVLNPETDGDFVEAVTLQSDLGTILNIGILNLAGNNFVQSWNDIQPLHIDTMKSSTTDRNKLDAVVKFTNDSTQIMLSPDISILPSEIIVTGFLRSGDASTTPYMSNRFWKTVNASTNLA